MKTSDIIKTGLLGMTVLMAFSCSDPADEITSLLLGRNKAPLEVDASSVTETSARISWEESYGATSYTMEVFEDDNLTYEGTPVETINDISADDIPYQLSGLLFDTQYSVRIQAITADDDSRTSKWNGTTFRTSAKQFMSSIKESDIADRSVIINWTVEDGYDVTTIVIGDITHEITPEEKAAGKATIEGLTPETAYTAYLYYNGKQCGNRSFTTIADLEGATLVHEGDNLKDLLENAQEGEVFAVFGGTYVISAGGEGTATAGSAVISKSITIKGVYPTSQPVINGRFELNDGAGLSISQVILDGTGTSGDQCFNYKTAGVTYGALDVQYSEIRNYAKGVFYLNVASTVESFTFNNCLIHDIICSGGDMFDSRSGYYKSFTLSNSTIYNSAASRDFIRMDDASGNFPGVSAPVITVDHCTLYNVGNGNANYRLFYVRFAGNKIVFTNNIVSGFNNKRGFTAQKETDTTPTLSNNFYHNTTNLLSAGATADTNIKWFDTEGTELTTSPFSNAANYDFTLNPDSEPARSGAGDPRWY